MDLPGLLVYAGPGAIGVLAGVWFTWRRRERRRREERDELVAQAASSGDGTS